MRYQQKAKQELDQKRTELLATRNLSPLDPNDNGKIQIGNGKVSKRIIAIIINQFKRSALCLRPSLLRKQVRQMFDERRQRVTGIDKSYPLQPISTRASPNYSVTRQIRTTVSRKAHRISPFALSARAGESHTAPVLR